MRFGKVRRTVLAASVLGLVAASPGISRAAGQPGVANQVASKFANQGATIKRLTTGVQMTKDDVPPARAYGGPTSMAVDPANPRIVVAATAQLRSRVCYLLRSADAGMTWHTAPGLPGLASYPYCTNYNAGVPVASLAFGRNGTLYYARNAYGDGEGLANGHSSIVVSRSTDLGNTWATTMVDNNRGKTVQGTMPNDAGVTGLTVDTSGPKDVVYVGYTTGYNGAAATSPLRNGTVNVAVSTDGGVTFATGLDLSTFSHVTQPIGGNDVPLIFNGGFGAPWLTAHNGVVLAVGTSQTPVGVTVPAGGTFSRPMAALVARSTDQGKSWTVSALSPPMYNGTGIQTGLGWTPKGGPQGTYLAAYSQAPASSATSNIESIAVQRSIDNGVTWGPQTIINDDPPGEANTSFYPQLSVAPNGRVDVVWEDNRGQADYHFQVRYSYTNDGGVTWAPNVLVSDKPIDFSIGVSFNSDIRQPPGVASANQYAVFGWADTRLGNQTNQNQDDFSVVAQFAPLPNRSSTVLPMLEAIFGGLVLAGVVLLVVLFVRSRREGPEPPKVEQREPVGAGAG